METNNNYIVYAHRRLDNNQIFYIGKGLNKGMRKRHLSKNGRNKHWYNIVNKVGYEVEIFLENLTNEKACEVERKLISYYGRKDLGLGNLVNVTDGGEGVSGYKMSEESKQKMREAKIGKKLSEEHRVKSAEILKKHRDEFQKGVKYSDEKKQKYSKAHDHEKVLLLNIETGIFYLGYKDAAESINIKLGNLKSKLSGRVKNNTNLIKV